MQPDFVHRAFEDDDLHVVFLALALLTVLLENHFALPELHWLQLFYHGLEQAGLEFAERSGHLAEVGHDLAYLLLLPLS